MQILIFDMDGVLLESKGYHRALQETMRLVSLSLGFEEFILSNDAISRFEALGISSEFQSSALCMALMMIEAQKRGMRPSYSDRVRLQTENLQKFALDPAKLFAFIAAQPIEIPAMNRSLIAIEQVAQNIGVDPGLVTNLVRECESLSHSLTFNIFQELVLGSTVFEQTYGKASQLGQGSYLSKFDRSFIDAGLRSKISNWFKQPEHGAAIMTNRPSDTILGFPGTPEAELGAKLIGLDFLSNIGLGEMIWLANHNGEDVWTLLKPASQHALSAILAASGMPVQKALLEAHQIASGQSDLDLSHLDGSSVYVFEDTPAGMVAVDNAKNVLMTRNVNIQVQKAGIANDSIKAEALEAQGARVFDSVGAAIDNLL